MTTALPKTIPHAAQAAALRWGDKPALIENGKTTTFNQLWAEALQMYKNGFKLWLDDPKVEEIALEQQQERESQDAWQDKIAKYLENLERTTGLEIWTECMQGFASEFDRGKQMRIADCLRRLKWDRKTICVDGKHIKGYFAPDKWQHKSPWAEEEDWKNAEG